MTRSYHKIHHSKHKLVLLILCLGLLVACGEVIDPGPPAQVAGLWQGDVTSSDPLGGLSFNATLRLRLSQDGNDISGNAEERVDDDFDLYDPLGSITGRVRGDAIRLNIRFDRDPAKVLELNGSYKSTELRMSGTATLTDGSGGFAVGDFSLRAGSF